MHRDMINKVTTRCNYTG